MLRRAFEVANKNGDLTFSAYSWHALTTNLLAVGDPLSEVQGEVEHGLAFAEKTRFRVVVDLMAIQLGLIRTLRGLTPKFGPFNDTQLTSKGSSAVWRIIRAWRVPSSLIGLARCRRALLQGTIHRP